MIEQYFVKGIRFTWTAPTPLTPAQDGTVVQSDINPGPLMTYAGISDHLNYDTSANMLTSAIYKKSRPPSTFGLNTGTTVPYVWVNYVLGRTGWIQPGASDVLTGFMSGCWIVQWTENGARRVGHIGTVESAPKNQPPNTTVKTTFRNHINGIGAGANLTGYNPALSFNLGEITKICKEAPKSASGNYMGNAKIMSLVTATGAFYSILMIRNGTEYICGGKKLVPPTDQAGVLAALA